MKPAVPILLWLFHTAFLTLENTFTECTLHFGRVFHELLNWNVIRLGNKLEGADESQTNSATNLVLDQLENLLFHLTIYTVETFNPKRVRNALRASISDVLVALTMNFLSNI